MLQRRADDAAVPHDDRVRRERVRPWRSRTPTGVAGREGARSTAGDAEHRRRLVGRPRRGRPSRVAVGLPAPRSRRAFDADAAEELVRAAGRRASTPWPRNAVAEALIDAELGERSDGVGDAPRRRSTRPRARFASGPTPCCGGPSCSPVNRPGRGRGVTALGGRRRQRPSEPGTSSVRSTSSLVDSACGSTVTPTPTIRPRSDGADTSASRRSCASSPRAGRTARSAASCSSAPRRRASTSRTSSPSSACRAARRRRRSPCEQVPGL